MATQSLPRATMRRISIASPRVSYYRLFSSTPLNRSSDSVIDLAFTKHDPPTTPSKPRSPIIIMHGLFGSQRNNRTLILAKQLSRAVYTIDLRNHGDSPHSPKHNYTTMSTDVEAFISSQNIPAPILIGHSMGAKVAMALALRNPTGYSGIVPVDNSPVDAALKSDFGSYVRGMLEVDAHEPPITKQSDADKILQKYEPELSIRQFLLTNLVKDPEDRDKKRLKFRVPLNTLAKALPDMADFPFKDPERARFEGPCLVIRGGESRYVADETLPVMGRFFPRFELVDVPGAGHWVISERFDECVRAIVDWVGRCVDGDGEGDKK